MREDANSENVHRKKTRKPPKKETAGRKKAKGGEGPEKKN